MKSEPAIEPLEVALKAASTGLKSVDSVAGYFGLDGAPGASPSAVVFYAGADYAARATTSDRKHGSGRFLVLLAFKQAGKDGGKALARLQPVRDAVIEALDGWRHPDTRNALELKRSRLLLLDRKTSTLWWELTFTADHYLGS